MTKTIKTQNITEVRQLNAMTATNLPDEHEYRMGWISRRAVRRTRRELRAI
jgi:hypothetical protein